MKISNNALTGNIETLNEFEGNGNIHKIVRPEREPLQDGYVSQDWLFRHDMSEDIKAEEAEAEAFVKRMELTSLTNDANANYRISWGAERHFDDSSDEMINTDTL